MVIMSHQNTHPKHRNQVRITGGTHRGRKLTFVSAEGLRPTPESVRERVFNWLGQDLTGSVVLDLFAGSGALGFEAASRGAKHVVLCDAHKNTAQQLKNHRQILGLDDVLEVHQQTALAFLAQTTQRFDLVFLDPPFCWQEWADLFVALRSKLTEKAYIYIEAEQCPDLPDWLCVYRQGKSGKSQYALLKGVQQIE